MRILTVGASPFLLVRNGRMNADVLKYFKSAGHEVASACWHHDDGYFLPEMGTGIHFYETTDGKQVCPLFPFISHPTESSSQVYETMKRFAPDVVITIGDYKETDFMYAIKAMYPNLFKWIAVFTLDCPFINETKIEMLDYADYAISTTMLGESNLSSVCKVPSEFVPYGPNQEWFFDTKFNKSNSVFRGICTSKNALSNNLGNIIKAAGIVERTIECDFELLLHTNLYDPGEYDLSLLAERYEASSIKLPEKFVSIKDSIPENELNDEYNKADFIVDCAVKSATALSLLEGMLAGCLPIGPRWGRVGEVISAMPEEFQFFLDFDIYIGKNEEEFAIVSANNIARKIIDVKQIVSEDSERRDEAKKAAINVAKTFSNTRFLERIAEIVEQITKLPSVVAVETF